MTLSQFNAIQLAEFALLRAKVELELIDDTDAQAGEIERREFVRQSTLRTMQRALEALTEAMAIERRAAFAEHNAAEVEYNRDLALRIKAGQVGSGMTLR